MACNCGSVSHSQPVRVPATGNGYAPLCAPQPACPACGELECLCRPLWTAGMIVSEEDLNRLDRYMLAKQRLHNRNLHGVGVVAGLIVTCHPCGDGRVKVSAGYAIGPCGEDIVVCKDDVVDVCALIQKCRSAERGDTDCRPWGHDQGCKDLTEDWIIAIRYDEQPSRNAPMLRAGHAHGDCGCGCGGKEGGSCGCGGKQQATASRQVYAQDPSICAPSVICETYRYEVFPVPPAKVDDRYRNPLLRWLLEAEIFSCLWDLIALAIGFPKLSARLTSADRAALAVYCSRIKAAIADYGAKHGSQRCAALLALCNIPCPDAGADPRLFLAQAQQFNRVFYAMLVRLILDCICLKLLPALQPPAADPRIPLAAVKVDLSGQCRVIDICNWTPLRPIVLSATAVEHWLRLFGIPGLVRPGIAALCCAVPDLMGYFASYERTHVATHVNMRHALNRDGDAADLAPSGGMWNDRFTRALIAGLNGLTETVREGGFEALPKFIGDAVKTGGAALAASIHESGFAADPAKLDTLEKRLAAVEKRLAKKRRPNP